jgi:SAM-dependent methyltransferase
MSLKHTFSIGLNHPLKSPKAYNLWSSAYDSDDDNLVFKFDNEILDVFLIGMNIHGKKIMDYGCGTGRNWQKFYGFNPKKIIGLDSSAGMLEKLKAKFPEAETYLINKGEFPSKYQQKADLIISTLVAAHVKNLRELFVFWRSILQPVGEIIMTDLHPVVLSLGGKRTFRVNDRTLEVKNYIHSMEEIKEICIGLNMKIERCIEKFVDDEVKDFYLRKNALHVFNKFKGTPMVYGLRIKSSD